MIYITVGLIVVIIFSVRAAGFAVWQFKNKNPFGGAVVLALSAAAIILTAMQLKL